MINKHGSARLLEQPGSSHPPANPANVEDISSVPVTNPLFMVLNMQIIMRYAHPDP